MKEYGVLNKRFARYYGFEQFEVDALCKQYQITAHKQKQLAEWYNGYSYGGLKLYNPWSIVTTNLGEHEFIILINFCASQLQFFK